MKISLESYKKQLKIKTHEKTLLLSSGDVPVRDLNKLDYEIRNLNTSHSEAETALKEMDDLIKQVKDKVSNDHYDIFYYRFVCNWPYKKIASEMSLSLSSVKNVIIDLRKKYWQKE